MDNKLLFIPAVLIGLWAVFFREHPVQASDVIPAGVFAPVPEEGYPPRVRVVPEGYPGLMDIDNDGFVTDKDLKMVVDYWQGNRMLTSDQLSRADYDHDGVVGMYDVLGLGNYLMYGQYSG